jgi:hypothetical protein
MLMRKALLTEIQAVLNRIALPILGWHIPAYRGSLRPSWARTPTSLALQKSGIKMTAHQQAQTTGELAYIWDGK